ncbi:MAG: asparagine synthase (glutamine-hydrolyzing) [Planctomycetota bacterium]|jgi:asparagine synthase (glutamine-hydrolysing)|nr:asparagine synthase (glutamine-hydrolyzing) [Planctomycetota bacterium]
MCGICGFVGVESLDKLHSMTDAIAHRGPDADGFFCADGVSLGHRRLSIVDIERGQQPMADDSGNCVIVFNGEIYNHPELSNRFSTEQPYRTTSDTETILRAYGHYGTACVHHLEGMFAFVLFDRSRRMLFGARDRFGEKPLYYTTRPFRGISFAFASELKALRACDEIAAGAQLSDNALISYLLNDYVTGNHSIWDGISQLGPGSAFTYGLSGSEREGFHTWAFWQRAVAFADSPVTSSPPSYADACDRLVHLLVDAVKRRFMADVPVGVLLSGGIDSSTIVACAERAGCMPLQTFSIGFDEGSFDETPFSADVARHFGTDHHHRTFTSADLVDRTERVTRMMDEPFADPSVMPTSLLCELAAEHVKTVLGGDGADELLAGYDPFKALRPARTYERLVPRWAHQAVVSPLTRLLPDSDANMSLAFKLSRFLRGIHQPEGRRVATWMGAFSRQQLAALIPDTRWAQHYRQPSHPGTHSTDAFAIALDFYQESYLTSDILVKMDRASMLHSLEVRTPFLDTALAEYVNGLPSHYKYRRGVTKRLLKDAVARSGLLPTSIIHRRKKGFGIPVARWMRGELHDYFRDTLLGELPRPLDMLSRPAIQTLWDRHQRRQANCYKELWALFMLIQWARFVGVATNGVSQLTFHSMGNASRHAA